MYKYHILIKRTRKDENQCLAPCHNNNSLIQSSRTTSGMLRCSIRARPRRLSKCCTLQDFNEDVFADRLFIGCCTDTECQVASFDNKKMICNLYKSSEDAFLFPGDVSFYRKVHCKTDLMRDVRSRGETYSKADTIGTKNLSVSLTYLVCFTLLVKK